MKRLLVLLLLITSITYGQDSIKLSELHPTLEIGFDSLPLKRSMLLEVPTIEFKQPKFKEYIPSGTAVFLAGIFDGVRDWSLFHAHGKGQFWDGAISHNNKYKNGDRFQGPAYFGSTNILAWTTDAPHLFNMLNHQATGIGFALLPYNPNKKIGHVILETITYNVVRQLGQSLMYSVILK